MQLVKCEEEKHRLVCLLDELEAKDNLDATVHVSRTLLSVRFRTIRLHLRLHCCRVDLLASAIMSASRAHRSLRLR